MDKGLLVILPGTMFKFGDRVFYYDHPVTGDQDFDSEWVRVYESKEQQDPSIRLHLSKVKIVNESMICKKWGSLYLKDDYSLFR